MTDSPLTAILRKRLAEKPVPKPGTPATLADALVEAMLLKATGVLGSPPDTEIIRYIWDKIEGTAPVKTPRATKKGLTS